MKQKYCVTASRKGYVQYRSFIRTDSADEAVRLAKMNALPVPRGTTWRAELVEDRVSKGGAFTF